MCPFYFSVRQAITVVVLEPFSVRSVPRARIDMCPFYFSVRQAITVIVLEPFSVRSVPQARIDVSFLFQCPSGYYSSSHGAVLCTI